jgi:predicted small metal-binding protein
MEDIAAGGVEMSRQIRCECGYLARADSDEEVVSISQAHIAADHPDLSGSVSAEDIRGWIELVPD